MPFTTRAGVLLGLMIGILLATGERAHAVVMLDFEFVGSGQIVSPTDTVLMQGRVTNNGTDPLTNSIGGGMIIIASSIGDQYITPFPPGTAPAPGGLTTLAPGQSIVWDIALFTPFPIGGALGDPVLPGVYTFSLANITTTFFVISPQTFVASKAGASDDRGRKQRPGFRARHLGDHRSRTGWAVARQPQTQTGLARLNLRPWA